MSEKNSTNDKIFSGNIFIYYAFDVGDDINLGKVESSPDIMTRPQKLAKYFKGYHVPLSIDLPHPHTSSKCIESKVHNFGVISLTYQVSFEDTLSNLRKTLSEIDLEFREQSVDDAHSIFKKIKPFVKQKRFFHLRTCYFVIQVDQQPNEISASILKEQFGGVISSLLRFETETLSEYQKNAILESAIGYYRGDLIVIDTDSAFVYDDEYEEILPLFEFANIQHVELQYYDRSLDEHLNLVYQREKTEGLPIKSYLPFISLWLKDPIRDLGFLRVEISAIIERLESTIKSSGEAYVTETYDLLVEKLDLKNWKDSINSKLAIIKDIYSVYQNKIDAIREDLLSVLIIVLIFIELVVGILSYLK